jgi:light-regulated signal transduction histidine kinase (bacteriophytochrome)
LFLWLMRVRMIKPVLDMTVSAAAVARGEPYISLPKGGPMEIEGLATQIRRVGEYISETKRIEDELRNKMFMLKKAKEKAEMDQRSKSEFLAYIAQEMRHPLNSIVGFAQVMKDQLYGPIENRKYKQYTADIYHAGNGLLNHLQDLQTMAAAETGYIELLEKPLDVSTIISKSLQVVSDKMQTEKISTKIKLSDPLPRLIGDEFRIQQILTNLFMYVLPRMLPESSMLIEAKSIGENKDRLFFALIISTHERQTHSYETLAGLAERLINSASYQVNPHPPVSAKEMPNIGLQLARMLVSMHHGIIDIHESAEGAMIVTVLFGASRIRFMEE